MTLLEDQIRKRKRVRHEREQVGFGRKWASIEVCVFIDYTLQNWYNWFIDRCGLRAKAITAGPIGLLHHHHHQMAIIDVDRRLFTNNISLSARSVVRSTKILARCFETVWTSSQADAYICLSSIPAYIKSQSPFCVLKKKLTDPCTTIWFWAMARNGTNKKESKSSRSLFRRLSLSSKRS